MEPNADNLFPQDLERALWQDTYPRTESRITSARVYGTAGEVSESTRLDPYIYTHEGGQQFRDSQGNYWEEGSGGPVTMLIGDTVYSLVASSFSETTSIIEAGAPYAESVNHFLYYAGSTGFCLIDRSQDAKPAHPSASFNPLEIITINKNAKAN